MKFFILVILALTSPVLLLILLSRVGEKTFKSCGESCKCFDEEMLGCEASVV